MAGAILFEETLYQKMKDGSTFPEFMVKNGIVPGIKVDKGLTPLPGTNGESICLGLDGLDKRCAEYYRAGARFAKWRTVVNIPAGPTELAVQESAHGLYRYGAIAQANGLVPIIEPEILLDGEHDINVTQKVWENVWAHTFFQMAQCGVLYEGILLKPSMVTPGAECKVRASSEQIAAYTIQSLKRRVPPAVPGINFLSGGQSEIEATANLNNMNLVKNPWNVSFSYARALQNSVLKTWAGDDKNHQKAQQALLVRAKANSDATIGKYAGEAANSEAAKVRG